MIILTLAVRILIYYFLLAADAVNSRRLVYGVCLPRFSYLLLFLIFTENSFSVHEKTTGPITMKFSGFILKAILCNKFCVRISKFESKIFDLPEGLNCPRQLQPTIGRLRFSYYYIDFYIVKFDSKDT